MVVGFTEPCPLSEDLDVGAELLTVKVPSLLVNSVLVEEVSVSMPEDVGNGSGVWPHVVERHSHFKLISCDNCRIIYNQESQSFLHMIESWLMDTW